MPALLPDARPVLTLANLDPDKLYEAKQFLQLTPISRDSLRRLIRDGVVKTAAMPGVRKRLIPGYEIVRMVGAELAGLTLAVRVGLWFIGDDDKKGGAA